MFCGGFAAVDQMATKRLAKELGLLRQRSSGSSGSKKLLSNQVFAYIIVIDFESTCWKEKNNYGQEIIEFPAVLLNSSSGEVESEFHSYVQPQEHPVLSGFCTELTGITQSQVEAGVPLQICLSRFSRWLQQQQQQQGLVFPHRQDSTAQSSDAPKLCTFLTWSDWDLGVCLQYECKRKQMNKPSVLNSWIDLRSTYRLFYNRKPKGLNGALQDLGIQFEGREHSGLDDARNTAQLAARMMREGCVLRITRSLDRMPITNIRAPAEIKKPANPNVAKDKGTPTSKPSPSFHQPDSNDQTASVNPTKSSVQSLVSPKTLLHGTKVLETRRSTNTSPNLSLIAVNAPSAGFTFKTEGCVPFPPHSQAPLDEIVAESEERCGSYDDVVLSTATEDFTELDYFPGESNKSIASANRKNDSKSGIEMCFAVPEPVGERRWSHCPARSGQTTSSSLNASEIRLRNSPKPQVLALNTPTFRKPTMRSFSVYADAEDSSTSRSSTSKSVLANVSVNTSLSRTGGGAVRKGEGRITSPLCECGRRGKRQTVSNGGPNQGRAFFCCPGRRSGGGAAAPRGCGFFIWESAVIKRNCAAAVGSSVSLCRTNTTANARKHTGLRKSF
ncbi:ERI1 exoribonuclease 2 [Eucyclogobius newberryi]|uniref:ERI1 exoribonuclease 2 n=1 Tax=Eucyclogobius newberryi TaxID=166745 RepID=UPI003B5BD149